MLLRWHRLSERTLFKSLDLDAYGVEMLNNTLETAVSSRTWVLTLLTLDVVLPFYAMMGLKVSDPIAFQKCLREATLAHRKKIERAITHGETSPMLADFCGYVESALGPSLTSHLVWWLENIFHTHPRDNLGLSHWNHVFRHCRHERERWQKLELPENLSSEILNRFRKAIDKSEYDRVREELGAFPLSDWDLHMYAKFLCDFDNDFEGPGESPFTDVLATIKDFQGYQFWAWMLRILDSDQQTRLRQAAMQVVHDEELTSVKDLPYLSELEIGL